MRKRSKYKPKGVRLDAVTWVLAGIKPFKEVPTSINIRIKNHAAMDALRRGEATREDMDVLIGAFNMTEAYTILRPDLGADWVKEIRAGQDALLMVAARGIESGRFVLKAQELVAMNLVMELHDAQLDQTNVREMELAMEIIDKEYKHHKMRSVQKVLNENSVSSQRAVAVQPTATSGTEATQGETSTKGTAATEKPEQD
jgi:hypothetical protein